VYKAFVIQLIGSRNNEHPCLCETLSGSDNDDEHSQVHVDNEFLRPAAILAKQRYACTCSENQ